MIRCNLAVLMAERGLNISDLSKVTGISRNALSALYHNTGKGIQFETLDALCDYLQVTPGDLLLFSPLKYSISDISQGIDHLKLRIEMMTKKNKSISGEIDVSYEISEYKDKQHEIPSKLTVLISYSPKIYEEIKQLPKLFSVDIEGDIISKVLDKVKDLNILPGMQIETYTDIIDYRELEE